MAKYPNLTYDYGGSTWFVFDGDGNRIARQRFSANSRDELDRVLTLLATQTRANNEEKLLFARDPISDVLFVAIPGNSIDSYYDYAVSWNGESDNWAIRKVLDGEFESRSSNTYDAVRDSSGNILTVREVGDSSNTGDTGDTGDTSTGDDTTGSPVSVDAFNDTLTDFSERFETVYNNYINLLQESDSIFRSLREFISEETEPEIANETESLRKLYLRIPVKMDRVFNIKQIYLRYGVVIYDETSDSSSVLCTDDNIEYESPIDEMSAAQTKLTDGIGIIESEYESFKSDYRAILNHLKEIIITFNTSRQNDLTDSFSESSEVSASRAKHGIQFSEDIIPPELKSQALSLIEASRTTTSNLLNTHENDIIAPMLPDDYLNNVLNELIESIVSNYSGDPTDLSCPVN